MGNYLIAITQSKGWNDTTLAPVLMSCDPSSNQSWIYVVGDSIIIQNECKVLR